MVISRQIIKELMAGAVAGQTYRLGKEASLSHSTITNLFKRNNAPTIPTLEAVCRAFPYYFYRQFFSEGNTPAELTGGNRSTLFAAWSTLNDGSERSPAPSHETA